MNFGFKHSEETKRRISKSKKGQHPKNELKKGCIGLRLGSKHSEETKKKISIANKGKHNSLSTEFKNGSSGYSGHIHSKETKIRMSKIKKNKSWTEERRKAQEARKGIPYKRGEERKVCKLVNGVVKATIRKPYKSSSGKEYHPDWHLIRKRIYKRDSWTCQECGVHCRSKGKEKIQCHHIDYDETNNEMSNLITLCASCHCKTNFKRKDWIKHYTNIIGGRGLIAFEK